MQIDLHGCDPRQIEGEVLQRIVRQAWDSGAEELKIIHGHGRGRGISPGFVHTNTGYFGLVIRGCLRTDPALRKWIKYTTIICSEDGATTVKLKTNRSPTRTEIDMGSLPKRIYGGT